MAVLVPLLGCLLLLALFAALGYAFMQRTAAQASSGQASALQVSLDKARADRAAAQARVDQVQQAATKQVQDSAAEQAAAYAGAQANVLRHTPVLVATSCSGDKAETGYVETNLIAGVYSSRAQAGIDFANIRSFSIPAGLAVRLTSTDTPPRTLVVPEGSYQCLASFPYEGGAQGWANGRIASFEILLASDLTA